MISGGHYEVVAAKKVLHNVPINELPADNDEVVAMAWRDMPFEMIDELGKDNRSDNINSFLRFCIICRYRIRFRPSYASCRAWGLGLP